MLAPTDADRCPGNERRVVTVSLRIQDDGAWLSVDDKRRVGVGELWRFDDPAFCDCNLPDAVVENLVEPGVDGRTVELRAVCQCIVCGEKTTTDWLPVGRVVDGEWRGVDRDGLLLSNGTRRA